MSRRASSMTLAAASLTGAALLAGCSLPFGLGAGRPADGPETTRSQEQGLLTGLFTRAPRDLPDAVPVSMREAAVERGYGGVILRVTGVAPSQGFHDAALVPANAGATDAAGVLTVALVAVPPDTPQAVGPERTRLLLTGAFLSDREMRSIRGFRVVAGPNSVTLPAPPVPAIPPPTEAELDADVEAAF